MKTLEDYLGLPWTPVVDTTTEGENTCIRLTVPGIPDFAVYGETEPEVWDRWKEALASHLKGYLKIGKVIPGPMIVEEVTTEPADETGSIVERSEPRKRQMIPV